MKFINSPNLPQEKVSLVALSYENQKILYSLSKLGIKYIKINKNAKLENQVAYHSDMNMLHLGGDKVILTDSNDMLINDMNKHKFNINHITTIDKKYPNDCKLNCVIINNIVIYNNNCIDKKLYDYFINHGFYMINTKQGYCKCSVCIINENAIITDDISIYKSLYGIVDILYINKGDITINGYDYGFIGGASGLVDKNVISFTGDIAKHSSYNEIKLFLKKHKCEIVCLTSDKLFDVGSILPLKTFDFK